MSRTKHLIPSTIIPSHLYVRREADRQVFQNIQSMGRPGYVLVSRQMGKTNLLIQTKRELESANQIFAYIDLSNKLPTSKDCFRNIIDSTLATHSAILSGARAEILQSRERPNVVPSKEFEAEILTILNLFTGKIIIILDEIDALIDTAYSDEIFAQIRSVYFNRVNYRAFERLTFMLSGVAEPSTLIKDRTKSPFNIGEKIYLNDFAVGEFKEFLTKSNLDLGQEVEDRIYYWVSGHPRMTWDVCSALEDLLIADCTISTDSVDNIIRELYLSRFDVPPIDHIRDLVRSDKAILRSIKQINRDPKLRLTDLIKKKLYLSGIIESDSSHSELKIKNRVIEASLSNEWLEGIESLSLALVFMGDEQKQQGHFHEAIKNYSEALERNDVGDTKYKSLIVFSIAHCYQQLEDWNKALDFYNKCSFNRTDSPEQFLSVLLNTGVCHFANEEYQKASTLFEDLYKQTKRGIFKWKACVNYAGTLIRLGRPEADQKALELYQDILKEAEEFEDIQQEIKGLQTIASFNVAEILIRTKNPKEAQSYLERAILTANKDFEPHLLLRLFETETNLQEKQYYVKRAVDAVISNRLDLKVSIPKALIQPQMVFDIVILRKVLQAALITGLTHEFTQLSEFTRTHYLRKLKNNLDLILWIIYSDPDVYEPNAAIQAIEDALKSFEKKNLDDMRSVMNAHRALANNKRILKLSFFNDIKAFIAIFEEHSNFSEAITEEDLIDFAFGIVYLRDRREYNGAIQFGEIITKYFEQCPTELKSEFAAIFFLMAQAYEGKGIKSEAKSYASRVLDLLKLRDPNKVTGLLAAQQLVLIQKETESIISRASLITPFTFTEAFTRNFPTKIGRNKPCPCGSGKKYKNCHGKIG